MPLNLCNTLRHFYSRRTRLIPRRIEANCRTSCSHQAIMWWKSKKHICTYKIWNKIIYRLNYFCLVFIDVWTPIWSCAMHEGFHVIFVHDQIGVNASMNTKQTEFNIDKFNLYCQCLISKEKSRFPIVCV